MTDQGAHLRSIVNQPENWNFSGAGQLYAGVDLGTYKAITIVVNETGNPRAAGPTNSRSCLMAQEPA